MWEKSFNSRFKNNRKMKVITYEGVLNMEGNVQNVVGYLKKGTKFVIPVY